MEGNSCTIDAGFTEDEVKKILEITGAKKITADAIEKAELKLAQMKLVNLKQLRAELAVLDKASKHPKGLKVGTESLMTVDRNELSAGIGLQAKANVIIGSAHSTMQGFMKEMRPKTSRMLAGMIGKGRKTAEQIKVEKDFVDHIQFGDKASPEISEMARAFTETIKNLRMRMSEASGVDLMAESKMSVPQSHDAIKINKAGFDKWFEYTIDKLDLDEMELSGKTEPELKEIMTVAFNNLRTNGAHYISHSGKGDLITGKYTKSRFLHFKDGESWRAYQEDFGSGNLYQTMTNHIDGLSRDIAVVELLGNNPTKTLGLLENQMVRGGFEKKDFLRTESMFNIAAGRNNGEGGMVASILPSIRSFNVSTQMGSATLAAAGDAPLTMLTAKMNDMPAFKPIKAYAKSVAGKDDVRELAGRMGLLLEYSLDRGMAANDGVKNLGSDYLQNSADLVMRASGLEYHTTTMRASFGASLVDQISSETGTPFASLSKNRLARFKQYGIDEAKWDKIRKTEKTTTQGHSFVDPLKMDVDTQAAFIGMVLSETNKAVPTVDNFEQSLLHVGTKAGTTSGELMRQATQFKSMPLYMITTQLARVRAQDTLKSKTAYAAQAFISTVAVGALVVQMKELSVGNEPLDFDNPTLWVNAIKYSTGGNLVSDFVLNNGVTGYVTPFSEQLVGPTAAKMQDVVELLTFANGKKIINGDTDGFSEKAVKLIQKNTIGNNIWWSRLALEREVFDQINQAINPNWKAKAQKRMSKYGHEQYWKSGETTPEFMQ